MAVTTYHTAVCVSVKKREREKLMPAQSSGLPTAGMKQAALHSDRSNNRNSWTELSLTYEQNWPYCGADMMA